MNPENTRKFAEFVAENARLTLECDRLALENSILVAELDQYKPKQSKWSEVGKNKPGSWRVRRDGPDTSWIAADAVGAPVSSAHYNANWDILTELGPLTDDAIHWAAMERGVKAAMGSLRLRRKELVDDGWVEDTGEKGESDAGKPAKLWRAIPSESEENKPA